MSELRDYVYELLRRGFTVFAVRGRGQTLDECKMPLNIPRGFKYERSSKNVEITRHTLRLIEEGKAHAIAVAGIVNDIMWIDVEHTVLERGWFEILIRRCKFSLNDVFIELTPRGGAHIALKIDNDRLIEWTGLKGYVDNKTRGYCVTYPSVFRVGENEYKYDHISSVPLWETAEASKYVSALKRLLSYVKQIAQANATDKTVLSFGAGSTDVIYNVARIHEAEPFREYLSNIVSKLDIETVLKFFYLVLADIGCHECAEYYILQLLNDEPIEMCNMTYPLAVERGLHTVFEVELLGALRLIGCSEEQLYEICRRIRYTCNGKEYHIETPVERNLRYNVLKGRYTIAKKGLCPLRVGNEISGRYVNRACASSLVYKLSSHLLHAGTHRLNKLIEIACAAR